MPPPHTELNHRITRWMSMSPPIPRVHSPNETTNKISTLPTHPTIQVCAQKQPTARLRCAEPMINTTPHVRTRAQVAMETARMAPSAASTQARVCQSILPPPARCPGFAAAVMQQERHQRSMVQLSCRITRLENEVHQGLAVMDADTGKLLNYRQLMRNTKHKRHGAFRQPMNLGD